jgi:hypothetical protein
MDLHRYWLEWEPRDKNLTIGCGVTAFDEEDALALIAAALGRELPRPARVIEDVDVSMLDPRHVVPFIYPSNERGVWFPKLAPLR